MKIHDSLPQHFVCKTNQGVSDNVTYFGHASLLHFFSHNSLFQTSSVSLIAC